MPNKNTILLHRERANITQAELGRRIGVSRSTICKWESGQRLPEARYWPALARVIGVKVAELVPEVGEAIRASQAAQ